MSKGDALTQVRNGFLTAAGAAVFGLAALWLFSRQPADDAAGGLQTAGGGLSTLTADNIGGSIMAAPAGYPTTLTADNLCGTCGAGATSGAGSGGSRRQFFGGPVPVDEGYYGGPVGGGVPFFGSGGSGGQYIGGPVPVDDGYFGGPVGGGVGFY